MPGDAGEHIGQPCLWIDVVHFGRDDQAVHGGRTLATAIGAGEEPRLASESNPAQGPLGSVVRQADAPVVEEAREGSPALEHVVHRLGDITATRELGPLFPHPRFEIGDEWRTQLLADRAAFLGALAVDGTLDLEQGIDAPDGLQRRRRDWRRRFAPGLAPRTGLDIGECEERPSRMGPAGRFQDRPGMAAA